MAKTHERVGGGEGLSAEVGHVVDAEGSRAGPDPAGEAEGVVDDVVQPALKLLDAGGRLIAEQEAGGPAEELFLELAGVVETGFDEDPTSFVFGGIERVLEAHATFGAEAHELGAPIVDGYIGVLFLTYEAS